MGGIGMILTPVLVRHLLGPLGLSGPMTSTSWTYIATPNDPLGKYNLPPAAHLQPRTHPLLPTHTLYMQSMMLKYL